MHSKDSALSKLTELVNRFEDQYDSYRKSEYNETLTRRDFIDPFYTLQSKIKYCEEKINEAVYKLYELTEEEIKIVEAK